MDSLYDSQTRTALSQLGLPPDWDGESKFEGLDQASQTSNQMPSTDFYRLSKIGHRKSILAGMVPSPDLWSPSTIGRNNSKENLTRIRANMRALSN